MAGPTVRKAAHARRREAASAPSASALPSVVHVTCDFPDPIEPAKTPVIRMLAELTGKAFDHRVYSLNRRAPSPGALLHSLLPDSLPATVVAERSQFEWGSCLAYLAPARGLFHRTLLHQLGDWLAEDLQGRWPDLLVAHKLTVEGIAVHHAATRIARPYAVTVQGDTDLKILAARPDLRPLFARIFHEAALVVPFAPWALAALEARLGKRQGPVSCLPCPTELDRALAPVIGGEGLVTAFHLRNHRRKNLAGMADAVRLLDGSGRKVALDVIGGGSGADVKACAACTAGTPGVRLTGPLGRSDLRSRFNAAAGFILPSHRESFGLVFVEALFAGLPVAYPRGAAIDGWFDGLPFAVPVDARDPAAIADAMEHLLDHEAELKGELAQWQASRHAARFRRSDIGRAYAAALGAAIAASTPARNAAA